MKSMNMKSHCHRNRRRCHPPPLPAAQGTLFRWGPLAAHVAFISSTAGPNQRLPRHHAVLVGGLTDGLLFAAYAAPLAARLAARGVALVQTLLSSSHVGWGLASLDSDADELHQLAVHLGKEYGSEVCMHAALLCPSPPLAQARTLSPFSPLLTQGIVLVGHSTGCQDAVRYCQRHRGAGASAGAAPPLAGVVLQAPVSDVEWLSTQGSTEERVRLARAMMADGQGEEVAFRAHEIDGAAITARRWLSLAAPGGDDDFFSSSLTDAQLGGIFGAALHDLPALVLLSGEEEYVPAGLDYRAVGRRLVQAMGPRARMEVVEGARHALNGREEEGAEAIACFVTAAFAEAEAVRGAT